MFETVYMFKVRDFSRTLNDREYATPFHSSFERYYLIITIYLKIKLQCSQFRFISIIHLFKTLIIVIVENTIKVHVVVKFNMLNIEDGIVKNCIT